MSRTLAKSLYGFLMDAVAVFVTTIALLAVAAALTVRFVRQRL